MKNKGTHFDCNNDLGLPAESAVRSYLSRNCNALPKKNDHDADVTLDLGVYGVVGVGVERIRGWIKVGEYQYPHYNLLTHKRARKMLNREEVFLFVVSNCLEQFMVITPNVETLGSDAYMPRGKIQCSTGSFERGSDSDPLRLAKCPWGHNDGREWAFKVEPTNVQRFDSAIDFPYSKAMAQINWTGPEPMIDKQGSE